MSFLAFENLNPNLPKIFVFFYEIPNDAINLYLKVGVMKPQLINLNL